MRAVASMPRRPVPVAGLVVVAGVLCAAGAAGALAAVGARGVAVTTYAATSTPALAADLTAGLGLVVAGVASRLVRPGRAAALILLVAAAWAAQDWIGATSAPDVVRGLAMVVAPFLLPLLVHLAMVWPGTRPPSRRGRAAVAVAYTGTAVVALASALVRDPLFDLWCWRTCTVDSFVVAPDVDRARLIGLVGSCWAVALGVGLVLLGTTRIVGAAAGTRRAIAPVLLPLVVVGAAEAGYALLVLVVPDREPLGTPFPEVFLIRATALAGVAMGLGWDSLRTARRRAAVDRLARDLMAAPAPGRLPRVLGRSLGDAGLSVAYWLDDPGCHVDASGRTVCPSPGPAQVATRIEREGREVAIVVHDGRLRLEVGEMERALGPAARLAVDNERLRAEALYRLADLRAAQARVVERSDDTRRRLERDLHDGAQQRLLAVSYELGLMTVRARDTGDPDVASLLDEAGRQARGILAELRELARGIFPAILADAGLGPALRTFADSAPLAVDPLEVCDGRCALAVETAAYALVVEATEDAVGRHAAYLGVDIHRDGDDLVVELTDDGAPAGASPLAAGDRIGAAGGHWEQDGPRLRAVFPCAS